MIITTSYLIGFKLPEEYQLALDFKKQHEYSDWIESMDTQYIYFKQMKTCTVEEGKENYVYI